MLEERFNVALSMGVNGKRGSGKGEHVPGYSVSVWPSQERLAVYSGDCDCRWDLVGTEVTIFKGSQRNLNEIRGWFLRSIH